MGLSKSNQVWMSALGGGALAVVGSVLLVTGVGSGAGAVLITSGLATIGSVIGGGMLAGIGVLAAGTATASALSAAIAGALIKDPELKALADKLRQANELYAAAAWKTKDMEDEISRLNARIGELLRVGQADREEMDRLRARLMLLIARLKNQTKAKTPSLSELQEKLSQAKQLFASAKNRTKESEEELSYLDRRIGKLSAEATPDPEELDIMGGMFDRLVKHLRDQQ